MTRLGRRFRDFTKTTNTPRAERKTSLILSFRGNSFAAIASPFFLFLVTPQAHGLPHSLGTSLRILTPATAHVRQPQVSIGRSLCRSWRGGLRAQPQAPALFPTPGLTLGKAFLYPGPWIVLTKWLGHVHWHSQDGTLGEQEAKDMLLQRRLFFRRLKTIGLNDLQGCLYP